MGNAPPEPVRVADQAVEDKREGKDEERGRPDHIRLLFRISCRL
jgi:hypothetical protein